MNLGDATAAAIALATGGLAKPAAQWVAKAAGLAGCGCDGRAEWLNRAGDWVDDRARAALGANQAILYEARHGLGDAVIAQVVVRHLAAGGTRVVDVLAAPGQESAFRAVARRVYRFGEQPRGSYAATLAPPLDEVGQIWCGHPSTKAELALLQLGMTPRPEWCDYRLVLTPEDLAAAHDCLDRLGGGRRVLLLHYQGRSGGVAKDIPEDVAADLARVARRAGWQPVVIDCDGPGTSQIVRDGICPAVTAGDEYWQRPTDSGLPGVVADAQRLFALGAAAGSCLAIDSGPGHCWGASPAAGGPGVSRLLVVWPSLTLHPANHFAPAAHAVHWLRPNHCDGLRGGPLPGLPWFLRHYRYRWSAQHLRDDLPAVLPAWLAGEAIETPVDVADLGRCGAEWSPRCRMPRQRQARIVVGIPHLFQRAMLEWCLAALGRSSVDPAEIVVLDNGGALALESLAGSPGARLFRPQRNLGVAGAWNVICERAEQLGWPVVLLNDDWCVGPGTLAALLAVDAEIALVRTEHEAASWSCVRLAAGVWRRLGPFDEAFWPAMYEDFDYAARATAAGVTMAAVRDHDSYHFLHATRERLPEEFAALAPAMAANRKRFIDKWGVVPESLAEV